MEDNILLAEFMGYQKESILVYTSMYDPSPKRQPVFYIKGKIYPARNLKFNTSWNWLMKVIEKIDNTRTLSSSEESYLYCVELYGSGARVTDGKTGEVIIKISEEDDYSWFEVAYKLAVEFIKIYNKNK